MRAEPGREREKGKQDGVLEIELRRWAGAGYFDLCVVNGIEPNTIINSSFRRFIYRKVHQASTNLYVFWTELKNRSFL